MDWQRERDGLVVVGSLVVLLALVATGGLRGFVATFVATFLGVLAALQVNGAIGSAGETSGAGAAVPTATGGTDGGGSSGSPADGGEAMWAGGTSAGDVNGNEEPTDGAQKSADGAQESADDVPSEASANGADDAPDVGTNGSTGDADGATEDR
ncbi:MAG: hypothetical protein ABEJ61_07645 [Haloferacaceae archaeon]